jgi:hypothetical protein
MLGTLFALLLHRFASLILRLLAHFTDSHGHGLLLLEMERTSRISAAQFQVMV